LPDFVRHFCRVHFLRLRCELLSGIYFFFVMPPRIIFAGFFAIPPPRIGLALPPRFIVDVFFIARGFIAMSQSPFAIDDKLFILIAWICCIIT